LLERRGDGEKRRWGEGVMGRRGGETRRCLFFKRDGEKGRLGRRGAKVMGRRGDGAMGRPGGACFLKGKMRQSIQ